MNRTARRLLAAASGSIVLGLSVPAASAAAATAGTPIWAGGVVHITHHIGGSVNTNQSDNWSGYNIGADYPQVSTGTLFTSVSGEWKVPKATSHTSGEEQDSATWIGIGGGCVDDACDTTDETLIQAGTEQDVSSTGAASYDAWWEILPEPETEVSLPVAPGNTIKVTIDETSTPGDWSIVIDNLTTGQNFSTTTPYSSSMDTVEWIEETPLEVGTEGAGLAMMPNLATGKNKHVQIYDATYNGANPAFQTIDEMQLDDNGSVEATPSSPGPGLNDFNDCTWATSCKAPKH